MSLKSIRKLNNLSTTQLADRLGVSQALISSYETGSRNINNIKISTLFEICNMLECNISEILTDEKIIDLINEYVYHSSFEK